MNLLEALVDSVKPNGRITNARAAFFAFADDSEESAFLSELPVEELVPLLERWCREQRMNMGAVH